MSLTSVLIVLSLIVLAISAQQFPTHLMNFGSATGSVSGLPSVLCSDAELPITIEFDYTTGRAKGVMNCSDGYSMMSLIDCDINPAYLATEICLNGNCVCQQAATNPNSCPLGGAGMVKLFVDAAKAAILGFQTTANLGNPSQDLIIVAFSQWSSVKPDLRDFRFPASCARGESGRTVETGDSSFAVNKNRGGAHMLPRVEIAEKSQQDVLIAKKGQRRAPPPPPPPPTPRWKPRDYGYPGEQKPFNPNNMNRGGPANSRGGVSPGNRKKTNRKQ